MTPKDSTCCERCKMKDLSNGFKHCTDYLCVCHSQTATWGDGQRSGGKIPTTPKGAKTSHEALSAPASLSIKESWSEEFDEKFGKDGPDKNSDSIGRRAGCDDCAESIEIRAEHKAYIKTNFFPLSTLHTLEELLAAMKKPGKGYGSRGFNAAIDSVLQEIRKLMV